MAGSVGTRARIHVDLAADRETAVDQVLASLERAGLHCSRAHAADTLDAFLAAKAAHPDGHCTATCGCMTLDEVRALRTRDDGQ